MMLKELLVVFGLLILLNLFLFFLGQGALRALPKIIVGFSIVFFSVQLQPQKVAKKGSAFQDWR